MNAAIFSLFYKYYLTNFLQSFLRYTLAEKLSMYQGRNSMAGRNLVIFDILS